MQRKYRGKYPTRIASIFSVRPKGNRPGGRYCTTNDGVLYYIEPHTAHLPGMMPNLGDDATEHPACVLVKSEDMQ